MNIVPIDLSSNTIVKEFSNRINKFQHFLSLNKSPGLFLSDLSRDDLSYLSKIFRGKEKENIYLLDDNKSTNSVLLFGDLYKIDFLINNLSYNQFNSLLEELRQTLYNYIDYNDGRFTIGNKTFLMNDLTVMGILNVTPDSFSDGGKYFDRDKAIKHGLEMIDLGVDIVDVGGESTRPGAELVDEKEELKRVIPVIEKLKTLRPEAIISIDSSKSKIANEALEAGAVLVNDISGLTFDEKMIEVVAKYNAAIVIMHIKGTPKEMQKNPVYKNVTAEVFQFLKKQTAKAIQAGIKNIIIDPGIGFGKRIIDNYELLHNLDSFKGIGKPILIGVSRKSFIGKVLNLDTGMRENATKIAETYASERGAALIRTHNVKLALEAKLLLKYLRKPEELING